MGKKLSGLYVAEVKKQYKDRTYSSFLLRRSYREDGKVKQETIANLSSLPRDVVFILRDILRGNAYAPQEQALECVATRSHGHVAAIAAMADQLRLSALLDPEPCPERDLVYALVVARVARPLTKLATTGWWQTTTLMDNPVVAAASPEDVYKALDWLIERQGHIERVLARRHLHEGGMVLCDLSSSYVEGTHCTLAAFGHNRDRKQGKRQINDGLLTDAEGRPVAIEVFPGNTADPKTVDVQLQKIKDHFQLGRVVLVGDRGMLTSARIEVLRERGGIDWLSALRSKEIASLAAQGLIPRSIFDERDLAEIHSPEFPGERLVVCRNPLLAEERVKHREALMAATEKMLERLSLRVQQGRLKRPEKIAEALGRIKNHYKVAKHFECVIGEGEFRYQRRQDSIQREAALDGIYVVRTSVPDQGMTHRRRGPELQASISGRTNLSHHEVCGVAHPSGASLDRGQGAGPLPALHAGLLRGMAFAASLASVPLRRCVPRRSPGRLARQPGRSFAAGARQVLDQADGRWLARAQLRDVALQPGHHRRQHHARPQPP